jgi:hypothetical protein
MLDNRMTLEKRIAAETYSYHGRMSVFVDDLHGNTVQIGVDEPFETAAACCARWAWGHSCACATPPP